MNVLIVGFGVVGRSFAKLLESRLEELRRDYHLDIRVTGVADSRSAAVERRGLSLGGVLSLKEEKGVVGSEAAEGGVSELLEESGADALVELTPTDPRTGEPGLTNLREALRRGVHVVTANKGPLVVAYPELRSLAEKNRAGFMYGAAVGGGNPVLAFGDACAASEPIERIEAIHNRTSNYILTEMEERGLQFDSVLSEARRIGLAEPDPSLDVDGIDQACKLVIVANHVLRRDTFLKDVSPVESIRGVTRERIEDARRRGKKVRALGMIEGGSLRVRLTELDEGDQMAVRGTADATRFHCKYSGAKMLTSSVGGPSYTAAGLLRELIQVQRRRE